MGKKKGKKKDPLDPNALTEVEKTFYELKLVDIRKRIDRLEKQNKEYEEHNYELEKEIKEINENYGETITITKKTLKEKDVELTEVLHSFKILERTREDDSRQCKIVVAQMEEEYEHTRMQLSSEIRTLSGKLTAIEEFRVQKQDLRQRYDQKERLMQEQEVVHKRRLYENERKFNIAKENLKRNMEAKLLQLSSEFQDITEACIPSTIHRMTRENIALHNELNIMLTENEKMYNEIKATKRKGSDLRENIQRCEGDIKEAVGTATVEHEILKQLTKEHVSMKNELSHYKTVFSTYDVILAEINASKNEIDTLIANERRLQQDVHSLRCNLTEIQSEYDIWQEKLTRLTNTLRRAILSVRAELKFQDDFNKPLFIKKQDDELINLLNILNKAKDILPRKSSLELLEYVKKGIELKVPTVRYKQSEQQVGGSFIEFLRVQGIDPSSLSRRSSAADESVGFPTEVDEIDQKVQIKRASSGFPILKKVSIIEKPKEIILEDVTVEEKEQIHEESISQGKHVQDLSEKAPLEDIGLVKDAGFEISGQESLEKELSGPNIQIQDIPYEQKNQDKHREELLGDTEEIVREKPTEQIKQNESAEVVLEINEETQIPVFSEKGDESKIEGVASNQSLENGAPKVVISEQIGINIIEGVTLELSLHGSTTSAGSLYLAADDILPVAKVIPSPSTELSIENVEERNFPE